MDRAHALELTVLAVCLVIAGVPFFRRADRRPGNLPVRWLAAAGALGLAAFLGSLPTRPPFSPGHGLGLGILVGSICGVWAAAIHLGTAPRYRSTALAAALTATVIPLLWMRDGLADSLCGVAMGLTMATSLALMGADAGKRSLAAGGAFGVLVAAVAGTAAFRGASSLESHAWCAVVVGIAGTIVLLRFLLDVAMEDDRSGRRRMLASIAEGAVIVGAAGVAAHLLGARLLDVERLEYAVLVGLGAGFVIRGAVIARARSASPAVWAGPLILLVLLTASMASFRRFQGAGLGIAMIAAVPIAFIAIRRPETDPDDETSIRLADDALVIALFAAGLALWRFFLTRYDTRVSGLEMNEHYALFGLLVGASTPGLCAAYAAASGNRSAPGPLRSAVAGFLVLAAPALMMTLWGVRSTHAMLIGVAFSSAIPLLTVESPAASARASLHLLLRGFMGLAMALCVTQWTLHLIDIRSISRAERVGLLSWAVAIGVVLIAAAETSRYLRARRSVVEEA